MNKTKIFIAVLWLLAVALASWTLAQLPLSSMLTSLQGLRATDYIIWLALNTAIILLLNQRWWLLTKAVNASVDFFELLLIRQAGQSISFITPGPQFGGEPLQLFWLWCRSQIPLHKALLALGLDRFFELVVNFSVLLLGVALLLATPASTTADWGKILTALIVFCILLALVGKYVIQQPQWLSQRITRFAQQWHNHKYLHTITTHWHLSSDEFRRCLQEEKKRFIYAALLSVAGWIGLITEMLVVLWMAEVHISLVGFLLLFIAMRLALLLPLPGGIGTMEAAIFWCFQYLGIPAESALVVIALLRLRDVLVLLIGLGCVGVLQRQPQRIMKKEELDAAN